MYLSTFNSNFPSSGKLPCYEESDYSYVLNILSNFLLVVNAAVVAIISQCLSALISALHRSRAPLSVEYAYFVLLFWFYTNMLLTMGRGEFGGPWGIVHLWSLGCCLQDWICCWSKITLSLYVMFGMLAKNTFREDRTKCSDQGHDHSTGVRTVRPLCGPHTALIF